MITSKLMKNSKVRVKTKSPLDSRKNVYWFKLSDGKAKLYKRMKRRGTWRTSKKRGFQSSDVTQPIRKHLKKKYKRIDSVGI